jgi:rubrerythrin
MNGHAHPRCSTFGVYDEALRARLCAMALAAAPEEADAGDMRLFLCPACGHIEPDRCPASCPICGALEDKFVQM